MKIKPIWILAIVAGVAAWWYFFRKPARGLGATMPVLGGEKGPFPST